MFGKKAKIEADEKSNTAQDEFSDFFDAEPTIESQNSSTVTPIEDSKDNADNAYTDSDNSISEKVDMVLYIVIDKPIYGMINYLRECGLKVSNVFNNITEAKNAVLMQSEPSRIVVIDTGLGKFTTTTMRAELIDMLGISDEHSKTTVFYTDSVLKVDTNRALGKSGKSIDWIQYQSTAVVAATLLNYREIYKFDMEDQDDSISDTEGLMKFSGITSRLAEQPRMKISGLSPESILMHLDSDENEELIGYEVNL